MKKTVCDLCGQDIDEPTEDVENKYSLKLNRDIFEFGNATGEDNTYYEDVCNTCMNKIQNTIDSCKEAKK